MSDRNETWRAGWYATKLHALAPGQGFLFNVSQAVCGAIVYDVPVTGWQERRIEKGLPKCKHCLRKAEGGGR